MSTSHSDIDSGGARGGGQSVVEMVSEQLAMPRGRPALQRRRLPAIAQHAAAPELMRFLVVGVANTLISFVVYRLLLAVGVWYIVAAPVAFAAGSVNGYVFNRRWTFSARDSTRARVLYVTVQVAGALATSLLVLLFVRGFGTDRVWAYIGGIPPVTLATFAANRLWTFADRDDAPARAPVG